MPRNSSGIVLCKTVNFDNRLIILDKFFGKKIGLVRWARPIVASLIHYYADPLREPFIHLSYIDCAVMPRVTAVADLGFLHLLLEVVERIVPWGSPVAEVYTLLEFFLMCASKHFLSSGVQLLIMLRLCIVLGFYPQATSNTKLRMHNLALMPLKDILRVVLDRKMCRALGLGLQQCLTVEMGLNDLKTFSYLPTESMQ